MATHKSAEKRNRQNERRRQKNVSIKSLVKTRVKAVLASIEQKDASLAQEELHRAVKTIDKAASKGVLHKNSAGRKVSRLTKKVNTLSDKAAD